MNVSAIASLYQRDLHRLVSEIQQYPNPESLWIRQGAILNSAGHLSQHLIGNLKTYIVQQLGGIPYVRDRDAEFGQRSLEQDALLTTLADLGQQLQATFSHLTDEQLQAPYPEEILLIAPGQTNVQVLVHLLTHLAYHTGQINYHRRMIHTHSSFLYPSVSTEESKHPHPMRIPFYQVDAFIDRPFSGNPAAVCLLDSLSITDAQLLAIAAENNLAETAFLWPDVTGFQLRWFTPTVEVSLCGHATLASAHALWKSGRVALELPIHFHTLSGELIAFPAANGWIELDFPARYGKPASVSSELCQALGINPTAVVDFLDLGDRVLLEVATEAEVRAVQPRFELLSQQANVIVTSRATDSSSFDFVSRFFAPSSGVAEDPVTGSAHCGLAPYWAQKLGKTEFLAYQASQRGGVLKIRLQGDRVRLAGRAVTIIEGSFFVPVPLDVTRQEVSPTV